MHEHVLKSGQLNFENTAHHGAFACVVIKDGKFYNLTPKLKAKLQAALDASDEPQQEDLGSMFG